MQIGLNVFTQVLVVVGIIAMINFVGFRQFKRWDFSRNQKYALSEQTKNLLRSLEKPVKAVVFFNPSIPIASDVNQLLKEYEYASKKKFEVEFVEPYRNILRAKELASKYKFGSSDNIVILDYDGRSKFVNAQDMAEFDQQDQFSMMTGQPPRLRSFKGEQAITSALLEITEEKQQKVYFVSGHGEPELTGGGIEAFKAYVERQNVKLEPLKLNDVDKVPDDANGLMIVGARADLSEREINLVSDFWGRKGRLFILLDADARTPRLDQFLTQNGITPAHDRVLRTGTGLGMNENQQIGLRTIVMISPSGVITERSKSITKDLAGVDTGFLGATQSLKLDQTKTTTDNIRLTPLVESSKEFWGETEFVGQREMPFFDPKKDTQGPLTIAAAAEKGAVGDPRVKLETARMIVAGNAGWLTDDGIRVAEQNLDFAINSLNWLLNREQLIGIAPKPKEPVKLDLDEKKLSKLALTVILIIPGIVAILGVGAWVARRA